MIPSHWWRQPPRVPSGGFKGRPCSHTPVFRYSTPVLFSEVGCPCRSLPPMPSSGLTISPGRRRPRIAPILWRHVSVGPRELFPRMPTRRLPLCRRPVDTRPLGLGPLGRPPAHSRHDPSPPVPGPSCVRGMAVRFRGSFFSATFPASNPKVHLCVPDVRSIEFTGCWLFFRDALEWPHGAIVNGNDFWANLRVDRCQVFLTKPGCYSGLLKTLSMAEPSLLSCHNLMTYW